MFIRVNRIKVNQIYWYSNVTLGNAFLCLATHANSQVIDNHGSSFLASIYRLCLLYYSTGWLAGKRELRLRWQLGCTLTLVRDGLIPRNVARHVTRDHSGHARYLHGYVVGGRRTKFRLKSTMVAVVCRHVRIVSVSVGLGLSIGLLWALHSSEDLLFVLICQSLETTCTCLALTSHHAILGIFTMSIWVILINVVKLLQKLWVCISKAARILLLVVAWCNRLEVITTWNLAHNLWLIVDQADRILNDLISTETDLAENWLALHRHTAWRAGHLLFSVRSLLYNVNLTVWLLNDLSSTKWHALHGIKLD